MKKILFDRTKIMLETLAVTLLLSFMIITIGQYSFTVFAANTPDFSQTINPGTLSVDMVDAAGDSVASPGVTFGAMTFNFDSATTTGSFGTASEKIQLANPTGTDTWSVTFAATGGNTAVWSDGGSNTFDFNDPAYSEDGADTDTVGGNLTIDPSTGTIAGVSGCATTNVALGSSSIFDEGVTDSITLFSASAGADTHCRWDLTGVSVTQSVPAAQSDATYTINMTLTAS